MGHEELLTALRQEGEAQAVALRRAAAEAEEAVRGAAAARREALRAEQEQRRATLCAARQREMLASAAQEAARIRLQAEDGLARRLRVRATACVTRLRERGYDVIFTRLAAELPGADWAEVRVNPADGLLAKSNFPAATIITDPGISGGLIVATSDCSLTVVNTLESRLERCWPDLLPEMLAELRRKST